MTEESDESERFEAFLDTTLKLTIEGTETKVPKGQVERMELAIRSWGFDALVSFWISTDRGATDSLFASFTTQSLIKVSLTTGTDSGTEGSPTNPIALTGYVTWKSVREETVDADPGTPVRYRRYTVKFADAARVLWKQHRPNDLFVNQTFQDVIDGHKGDKITTSSNWTPLTKQHPVQSLALGDDPGGASFYDLIAWYVDTKNGVFTYATATDKYTFAATKDAAGTATTLQPIEVARWDIDFPETPRMAVNVQNSNSASAATNAVSNEKAATGIRRDYLVRTSIAQDVTDRVTLETNRLVLRSPEVVVLFAAYPTPAFLPGSLFDFSHSGFGTNIFTASKTYRVREVDLSAVSPNADVRLQQTSSVQGFGVKLSVRAELEAETHVALPEYVAPTYPMLVEGTVVSEQGKDEEDTYQIYTDQNTSVDQYKVKIPLWSNKIVVAPYDSLTYSSHSYFPLIKNERVLVALGLEDAEIVRTLDWRAGARLPADGQGNGFILGKQASDQTAISHAYDSNALPIFTVQRTKGSDTEVMKLSDGNILIKTQDTGSGS